MQSASVVMSTLRRSDTGPSSSTFHRADGAVQPMMMVCAAPLIVRSHVNTHGSECDCLKPQEMSHGKSERCHRRPACAIP
eukprot:5244203-Pleurochrysis_carterae.AAC.1